ncbi:hypothetical protein HJC23_006115 [Cyclotella cryptica]|uniref:TLDc domain-containing protein n=1 Tax=Cyclotella cryptica TaxID=29204 RepID=A0ABD3QKZ4_9STRA
MNIFNFDQEEEDEEEEDSPPSSSQASVDETSQILPPRPHLNPAEVLALASSIPNCCPIVPPRRRCTAVAARSDSLASPLLHSTSSTESGVFSSFRRRLQRRFVAAGEDNDDDDYDEDGKRRQPDEILSFLVSDPTYAMHTLRAALDDHHHHDDLDEPSKRTSSCVVAELDGAGIARIDVYCRTGTVCTLRVVQGRLRGDDNDDDSHRFHGSSRIVASGSGESIPTPSWNTSSSLSPSAVLTSLLTTPRHRNVRSNDNGMAPLDCRMSSSSSPPSYSQSYSYSPSSSHATSTTTTTTTAARSKRSLYIPTQSYEYHEKRDAMDHAVHVRRMFRRKVTMERLRHILEHPPVLLELSSEIIPSFQDDDDEEGQGVDRDSGGNPVVDHRGTQQQQPPQPPPSQGRMRQKTKVKLSGLTEAQRRFLYQERRKYARRLREEERVRRHLSQLILNGGDLSSEHFPLVGEGMTRTTTSTTSLEHYDTLSCGTSVGSLEDSWQTAGEEGGNNGASAAATATVTSCKGMDSHESWVLRNKQREIQRKIALADMAMAILTGEVESVEKMMDLLQKERGEEGTGVDDSSKDDSAKERRNHPREGKRLPLENKQRGREGKEHHSRPRLLSARGTSSSCSLSVSVASSSRRQNDSFSTLEDGSLSVDDIGEDGSLSVDDIGGSSSSSSSSSSTSLDDSEAEEIARMLQGCEVEYSFPYDFHDELEDALLAQEFATDGNESYSSGVDTDGDSTSTGQKMPGNRRGRTRYRDNAGSKQRVEIPTIVAVPTNGQGCIVLRNNGAFSVVGILPKPLYRQLFRKRGPFPEYIALGTKGRYYVRFEDGTFKFLGPSSLRACLNQTGAHDSAKAKRGSRFFKNFKKKNGEIDSRQQHPLAIASLAFGNNFDDFFLVRNDGSWEYNGDLPRSLEKLLQDRRGRGDLQWVSLGPNQEWCLKANNGRIWWGGVSKEVDEHLTGILLEDDENGSGICHDLKFIDFGVDDTFFLLHR